MIIEKRPNGDIRIHGAFLHTTDPQVAEIHRKQGFAVQAIKDKVGQTTYYMDLKVHIMDNSNETTK